MIEADWFPGIFNAKRKKPKKKEAELNTILNKYFREQKIYCYYELKQSGTNIFSFSKIENGQYDGLQATEKNGLVWKWSDEISRTKPCDGASLPPLPSYLVIKFDDGFYMIRIGEIVKMRENGYISIKREQAERLAEKIIVI